MMDQHERRPFDTADSSDRRARRNEALRRFWTEEIAFTRLLGLRCSRFDESAVEMHLPFDGRFTNGHGTVHGGVISTLADSAMSAAVIAGTDFPKGSKLSTASLTVNYLAAASGDITATAHVVRRGSTVHFAEAHVSDTDGRSIAHAIATVIVALPRPS